MKYKFKNCQVAAAPIAWSNDDLPEIGKECTFEQILSEMALAGYQGSEVGNKFPRDLKTLLWHLELRKLKIASAWFSSYVLDQGVDKTLAAFKKHVSFLKALGCQVVVVSEQSRSVQGLKVPLFAQKPVLNTLEWANLAAGLNQLGAYAQTQGLKLVYHHHMGTIVQTASETRKLLELTNPQLVYLLFDTGHFEMAGEPCAPLILEFGSRIAHVHLKDIRPSVRKWMISNQTSFLEGVVAGMFTVPSDGVIDFDLVFKNLAAINYQGWFVVEAEQDPKKANPLFYAWKAMKFIETKIIWKDLNEQVS